MEEKGKAKIKRRKGETRAPGKRERELAKLGGSCATEG